MFSYKHFFSTYFGHILDHENLGHSNMIRTLGGRAGLSLSTGRPGYSSAQMSLEDKLIESEYRHIHSVLEISSLSDAPEMCHSKCFISTLMSL